MAINNRNINAMINNVKRRRRRLASDPVPPVEVFSFTVTAAEYAGAYYGYSNGAVLDPFGSIDQEPFPGADTVGVFWSPSNDFLQIILGGDKMAMVGNKDVWVNGTNYGTGWAYIDGIGTAIGFPFPPVAAGDLLFIEMRG